MKTTTDGHIEKYNYNYNTKHSTSPIKYYKILLKGVFAVITLIKIQIMVSDEISFSLDFNFCNIFKLRKS